MGTGAFDTESTRRDRLWTIKGKKPGGRPKEYTGREEDFKKWSKKTEAFFAGVIKESEIMLEWAAEQTTEITTAAIDLEFFADGLYRGQRSAEPGICVAADAHSTHGSHES